MTKAEVVLVRSIPNRMQKMKMLFKSQNNLNIAVRDLSDKLTRLDQCCQDGGDDSSDSSDSSVDDYDAGSSSLSSQNDEPLLTNLVIASQNHRKR